MSVSNTRQAGFTLVEMMITVAIVALLFTIAMPAYTDQVRKNRRVGAKTSLLGAAQAMERHFVINNDAYRGAGFGYLDAADSNADTGDPGIFPTQSPADGNTKYYDLKIQAATQTTYELRAVPIGDQANDKCGTLILDHLGNKSVTGGSLSAAECW